MGAELLKRSLAETRGGVIAWGIGLGLLGLLLGYAFPSVAANPAIEQYWETFPEELRVLFGGAESISSLPGYLDTELFGLLPILAGIVAIGRGAQALVGQEQDGTMDLLMAQPVPRHAVVLWEALGILVAAEVICLAAGAGTIVGLALGGAATHAAGILTWSLLAGLLAAGLGWVALAASAWVHRKPLAIMVGAGVAALGYFLDALAPLNPTVQSLQPLSPFYHYGLTQPLAGGLHLTGTAVLLAWLVPLAAIAVVGFRSKDLAV